MGRRGRPTAALAALLVLELAVAAALAGYGSARRVRAGAARSANRALVAALGLVDLALWSDASGCRHPAEAELLAALADQPSAMDHRPAGSLVPPPTSVRGGGWSPR